MRDYATGIALQKNLEGFSPSLEATQVGRILEVGDGIARVSGLPDASVNEMLEFDNGAIGLALNLDEDSIGAVVLGTTEGNYRGDPRAVHATAEEEAYLLDVQRHYFPQRSTQVVDRFAGLRVLPAEGGATFSRSRETHLVVDNETNPRTLSIYGGKLTVYRATAEKVMQRLGSVLPERRALARTDEVPLVPVD